MKNTDIYDKNGFVSIDDIIGDTGKYSAKSSLEEMLGEDRSHAGDAKRDVFTDIISDKVKFFKQILDEIDGQIKDRECLKDTIQQKIDLRLCKLKTKIYEVEPWGLGNNKNIDSRRDKLEKEIEALAKQKSEESRESWRDIALLRKEYRQFSEQYRNALRKSNLIGNMNENETQSP
ncbi:hypothetical protein KJ925_05640 [Patescibacteria group bacterium]|nr:hypothetical protein [Patescibacteria group bacterium]